MKLESCIKGETLFTLFDSCVSIHLLFRGYLVILDCFYFFYFYSSKELMVQLQIFNTSDYLQKSDL